MSNWSSSSCDSSNHDLCFTSCDGSLLHSASDDNHLPIIASSGDGDFSLEVSHSSDINFSGDFLSLEQFLESNDLSLEDSLRNASDWSSSLSESSNSASVLNDRDFLCLKLSSQYNSSSSIVSSSDGDFSSQDSHSTSVDHSADLLSGNSSFESSNGNSVHLPVNSFWWYSSSEQNSLLDSELSSCDFASNKS